MRSAEGGSGSAVQVTKKPPTCKRWRTNINSTLSDKFSGWKFFFKECLHQDENQRQQLSRELSLDSTLIKFWSQNIRTQTKAQNDRVENNALWSENGRFRSENLAFQEALKNSIFQSFIGSGLGKQEKHSVLQRLKTENILSTEESVMKWARQCCS